LENVDQTTVSLGQCCAAAVAVLNFSLLGRRAAEGFAAAAAGCACTGGMGQSQAKPPQAMQSKTNQGRYFFGNGMLNLLAEKPP
jgi:hypothetical protein